MAQRMILEVPGMPVAYARTLLDEALGQIEDQQMWSFQLLTGGFLTPGLLFPVGSGSSAGTITATPYSTTVLGDATASAAWNAYIASNNRPFFTELQIRSPYYSVYSIIGVASQAGNLGYNQGGYNQGGYPLNGLVQLTLDRPWMEPGGVLNYMCYQCYFPVPGSEFKRFLAARDTTNNAPMNYFSYSQRDLAVIDPERTIFNNPGYFVPYQTDKRPLSATLGHLLIEAWPHPLSVLPYTFNYLDRGPRLVNPGDTVPEPITEELLLWQAKVGGFLWKEANKGSDMQRGSDADYRFLAQAAAEQYKNKLEPIKDRDRDLVELYFTRMQSAYPLSFDGFANQIGTLNVGHW